MDRRVGRLGKLHGIMAETEGLHVFATPNIIFQLVKE